MIIEEKINVRQDKEYNYEYIARKQRDTSIILLDKTSGIKVYLSDYEIIKVLTFFLGDNKVFNHKLRYVNNI